MTVDGLGERARKFLIFHSSGMNCAFPLEAVREIVPMAKLYCPPGMPSGIVGFLNLRGTAIPIIHLDRLFELPDQLPGLHTPLIVLHGVLGPIGILVDSVRCIVPGAAALLLDIPDAQTFQGCATGAMQLDGDLIYLLSPGALLQASEERFVRDYSFRSQARLLHLKEIN